MFGFWKFFAQIGNFSRESVSFQGFCPVPFPPNCPGIIAGARASELPLFFLPGDWNFQHKGASVTVRRRGSTRLIRWSHADVVIHLNKEKN